MLLLLILFIYMHLLFVFCFLLIFFFFLLFFFFKQKTAYEMRISDWSSDVCSSDLALAFLGIHALEANFITPLLVGRRLTINPLLILLALSFWGWVWGTIGALLSVPLLIMMRVLLESAGKPDIAGFLFEERLLGAGHHEFHDHHEIGRAHV